MAEVKVESDILDDLCTKVGRELTTLSGLHFYAADFRRALLLMQLTFWVLSVCASLDKLMMILTCF